MDKTMVATSDKISDVAGHIGASDDRVPTKEAITDRGFRYPGGKGVIYKNLINLIPPHDTYIETHLGGGAVLRNKLPATTTIAIDIDPAVFEMWNTEKHPHVKFFMMDNIFFLKNHEIKGHTFIYADPPYLNCKSHCPYKYGYTEDQHVELIKCLLDLSSPIVQIMISGYWSELYADMLNEWRVVTFETMKRGGMATEYVWMNYPEPTALHDYRYLGDTFRDRERIKRKQNRWIANLKRMPGLERRALINRISEEIN